LSQITPVEKYNDEVREMCVHPQRCEVEGQVMRHELRTSLVGGARCLDRWREGIGNGID
jgi:hypothetical protein